MNVTLHTEEPKAQERIDGRPYLIADMGDVSRRILYPPKEYIGRDLSFNELVILMRKYETIPALVGNEMMFVGWEEIRLFFGTKLDEFLIDAYNILPTDVPERKKRCL